MLQHPFPRKTQSELNINRTVTESAPLNNQSYLQQKRASKEILRQSNNTIKVKKLNLQAQNFTGIGKQDTTQQLQQLYQQEQIGYQNCQNSQQGYQQPLYFQQFNNNFTQSNPYQYQYPQQIHYEQNKTQISNNLIAPKTTVKEKKKLSKDSGRFAPQQLFMQHNELIIKQIGIEQPSVKENVLKMKLELQEREQKMKEESRLKTLRAQPRSPQEIQDFMNDFIFKEDFSSINQKILSLSGRNHTSTRLIQNIQNRQSNQRSNTNYQQSNYQRNDKYQGKTKEVPKSSVEIEDFPRGTNIIQVQNQNYPEVRRYIEDPSVKLKQEELKKNLRWLESQDQSDDYKKKQKELKFKLNQLAPDNKVVITQSIINIILSEHSLAGVTAGIIMEKAWLEPRYRELYTEVCKTIVDEPLLSQEVQDEGGKIRRRQLFKDAILNRVQEAFESEDILKKSEEDLKQLSKNELEIQYIRRKNRILGNVRFIGDLFIKGVLPEQAIYGAQSKLLEKFLQLRKLGQSESVLHYNPEDQLEGLVELYDKAGQTLERIQHKKKSNKKITAHEEKTAIDAIVRALQLDQVVCFDVNFSVDGIFQLFRVLDEQLGLSTRINILIQNLEDRRNNNWIFHCNQKNESAKTLNELQREQEDLQYEDERKYRDKDRYKKPQQVVYQPKQHNDQMYHEVSNQNHHANLNTNQHSQSHQQDIVLEIVKNQVKKDINVEVQESFLVSSEEQIDILQKCLMSNEGDTQKLDQFWETFFSIILEGKQRNVERAGILYELIKDGLKCKSSFMYGLQQKYGNEDFLYDMFESQVGVALHLRLFSPFLEHNRVENLEEVFRVAVKEHIQDEWNLYMREVYTQLLQAYEVCRVKLLNAQTWREPLSNFFQQSLGVEL